MYSSISCLMVFLTCRFKIVYIKAVVCSLQQRATFMETGRDAEKRSPQARRHEASAP